MPDTVPAPPRAPAPRPLRADARRNRALLVRAADALMRAVGPALQMEEIARHAGVGIGTLYRHFPTREELLAALFVPRMEACVAEAENALGRFDAAAALRAFISGVAVLMAGDPGLAAALAGPGDCAAADAELAGREARLMERAREAGAVRPDLTAVDLRALIRGMGRAIQAGAAAGLAAEVVADGILGPGGSGRGGTGGAGAQGR